MALSAEQIKEFTLRILNLSEYTNLISGVLTLVERIGFEKINCGSDMLVKFKENLKRLLEILSRSRASKETEQMLIDDEGRERIVHHIFSTVKTAIRLPIEKQRTAALTLKPLTDSIKNIRTAPNAQQTQKIKALLVDFAKDEYAQALNVLGLSTAVAELENYNTKYEERSLARTQETAVDIDTAKQLRADTDGLYRELIARANATALISPSDEIRKFVGEVNRLQNETTTKYRQRSKSRNTKAATPDTTETTPDNETEKTE